MLGQVERVTIFQKIIYYLLMTLPGADCHLPILLHGDHLTER